MKKIVAILILLFIFTACQAQDPEGGNIYSFEEDVSSNFKHKKVMMILVDTMTGELVEKGIQSGQMPALKFLFDHGKHFNEVVAPFPSMSVTIESSIVTGEMADIHKVPGLSWYSEEEGRIINYGTSLSFLWKNGLEEGIYDAIYSLNNDHLSEDVNTIFEELDQHQLSSGAINTLVYRGNYDHQLTMPSISDELLRLPEKMTTKGPNLLAFGALTHPEVLEEDNFEDSFRKRFGLMDIYSMQVTEAVIKEKKQPDFLMVFLPDFDKIAHKHGSDYVEGFIEIDKYLQGILSAYGSWDKALEETIFLVVGDHGSDQQRSSRDNISIDLDSLFAEYDIAPLGERVGTGDLAFGVNQRMVYVYDVHNKGLIPLLADRARLDERIALCAWQEEEWIVVNHPESLDNFRFKKDGLWTDKYEQSWNIDGNENIVGIQVDETRKEIKYTDYPDVLNQLFTAMHSHPTSKVILVAKPSHNFIAEGIPVHPDGGEHGGLHKNDTLTSLIVAGTEQYPQNLRLVDLKKYIVNLLTVNPEPILNNGKTAGKPEKKSVLDMKLAATAKEEASNATGVTDVVSVAVDNDIFIALQVEQWHRFRLPEIRREVFHLIRNLHDGKTIHVTTDWKIMRDLRKLEKRIKEEGINATEVRKMLDKIEKNMKG